MHVGKTNGGGGKEVRETRKQEDEEQVEVQERQGLPGGLDVVAVDACADGVEAEGDASSS